MPIDIASGNVHLEFDDVSIPGSVDLIWDRRYSVALSLSSPTALGPKWMSRYDATLLRTPSGLEFTTPTGSVEMFLDPFGDLQTGGVLRNLGAFMEVFQEQGRYVVRSWNVETDEIRRYVFDPNVPNDPMPLASIEDETGQGLDLIRDMTGRLTAISQRLESRSLLLDYFPSGQIRTIVAQGPGGELYPRLRYEYDSNGRLSTVLDPLNYADHFEYDVKNRVTRMITRDGGMFSYRYDQSDRCVWYSGADHYDEKRLRFLTAARVTEVSNSYGAVSRYSYLPTGQIVSEWSPLGSQTQTEYDSEGRITAIITPTGPVTRYVYDQQGNRSEVINSLGESYKLSFNDSHQITTMKDAAENLWLSQYDEQHRLVITTDPLGGRRTMTYDDRGNLTVLTNPMGDSCRFHYEGGACIQRTDWKGNITRLEYDPLGRTVTRLDPLGRAVRYLYDKAGNLTQITLADNTKNVFAYDAGGNITRFSDGAGRVSTFRYGPCGRLLTAVDPLGNTVSYAWGTEPDRLVQVINERQETHTFLYDEDGQCIKEVGFDGRTLEFSYDTSGACIRTVNGAGEIVHIDRDSEWRILRMALPDGSSSVFKYDRLGNVVEAANSDSTVRLERDSIGRLVREVQIARHGEHSVSTLLDSVGEIIRLDTDLDPLPPNQKIAFKFTIKKSSRSPATN